MSKPSYFDTINKKFGNGFWINNPTMEQANLAIAAGAISCTTNPTYAEKMRNTQTDGTRIEKIILDVLDKQADDNIAARIIQRKAIGPLLDKFLPLYEKSSGKMGFVSIQGDPLAETDPDMIINEAIEDMKLGANVIAKIPATEAGLIAIKYLVARNIPIIATEVMSLSQAIEVCETYKSATQAKPDKPALYVTHITGIFDDYLNIRVKELGLDIAPSVLEEAGLIIARKQYKIMRERNYPGIMLGGGARALRHFTGLVGGKVDITVNWHGTADKLLEQNPEAHNELCKKANLEDMKALMEMIPEYSLAYNENALEPKDYESYGPVVLFRDAFVSAWESMLQAIKDYRDRN